MVDEKRGGNVAKANRVPRTLPELLQALDAQVYVLRNSLHCLKEDLAHLRTLAVGLRTLVCESSGTEGLLWRLVDEFHVSDEIMLECGGEVNRDHPLSRGLALATIPLWRQGKGPPGLTPENHSLRDVIKHHEAIYVAAVQDVVYTHELLICAIAGQMGAHEAEGLDHRLVRLNKFLINQAQLYVPVLAQDAGLILQICERVLDHAEHTGLYRRAHRSGDQGDVTVVVRFAQKQRLLGPALIATLRSPTSEVEIIVAAGARSANFVLCKRGRRVAELPVPYPDEWELHTDAVFALSYSSNQRQARTVVNDRANGLPVACDLGWLDAEEIEPPERHDVTRDFIAVAFVLTYCRMLRTRECGEILRLSPDLRELMPSGPAGPFPD
jgi:hypothetical protein